MRLARNRGRLKAKGAIEMGRAKRPGSRVVPNGNHRMHIILLLQGEKLFFLIGLATSRAERGGKKFQAIKELFVIESNVHFIPWEYHQTTAPAQVLLHRFE